MHGTRFLQVVVAALCVIPFLWFSCAPTRHSMGRMHTPAPVTPPERQNIGASPHYVVNGVRYFPLPHARGFVQKGKASWYGYQFHGNTTSSGAIFDMYKKSAAHKTLPFGTYVKVVNHMNNKETIVCVNDRGPFVKGRIIDLSYAAAKEVDLVGPGVTDVTITALGKEVGQRKTAEGVQPILYAQDVEHGEFTIQIGAFKDERNAKALGERLKVIFDHVHIEKYLNEKGEKVFRVRVSKSRTLTQAEKIEKQLEGLGFIDAFIVRI